MSYQDTLFPARTSMQRFLDSANYKKSWFLVLLEDTDFGKNLNFKANAELIDVRPAPFNSEYNAKAIYRVDREANGHPFSFNPPAKRYIQRTIKIQQITTSQLVDAFGVHGVMYLGDQSAAKTTHDLVAALNTVTDLGITTDDIILQNIPPSATCIMLTFNPLSVRFAGSMRVDVRTPVTTTL